MHIYSIGITSAYLVASMDKGGPYRSMKNQDFFSEPCAPHKAPQGIPKGTHGGWPISRGHMPLKAPKQQHFQCPTWPLGTGTGRVRAVGFDFAPGSALPEGRGPAPPADRPRRARRGG